MRTRKTILTLIVMFTLAWLAGGLWDSIAHAADEGISPGSGDDSSSMAQIVPGPLPIQIPVAPQATGEITIPFNTPYQYQDFHLPFPLDTSFDTTFCEMDVHAFDVDSRGQPGRPLERDVVYLNGRRRGPLRPGETNQWQTTTFRFPCSILVKGQNQLDVDVDVLNGRWATAIAWIKLREVASAGGCRVIDAGGTVAYYREVNGEPRLYSVDPATTFVVGWKDNRPQDPTNNVETTEAKGNVGVIFCWNPGAAVALQVAGWVGGGHLPTKVPLGLTADDFRRDATYDAEEGAWYLALGPRQAWTDFCLFDPANPCIFVAAERPAG